MALVAFKYGFLIIERDLTELSADYSCLNGLSAHMGGNVGRKGAIPVHVGFAVTGQAKDCVRR